MGNSPGIPKFFFPLDNVVHIHSLLYLPLIKLLDLVLQKRNGRVLMTLPHPLAIPACGHMCWVDTWAQETHRAMQSPTPAILSFSTQPVTSAEHKEDKPRPVGFRFAFS